MPALEVFTVRDIRNRSGKLMQEAESGHVSIITKHGRPKILAVPFDQRLIDLGLNKSVALKLFEDGLLTLAQSARLANLSISGLLDLLAKSGISTVDYPPEELEEEIEALT